MSAIPVRGLAREAEAWQFTGHLEDTGRLLRWVGNAGLSARDIDLAGGTVAGLTLDQAGVATTAKAGDWVVRTSPAHLELVCAERFPRVYEIIDPPRRFLYLDLDGVISAERALIDGHLHPSWPDFQTVDTAHGPLVVSPRMIRALQALAERNHIQVIWSSGWEDVAPGLAAACGLPTQWNTTLDTTDQPGTWGKLHAVQTHLAGQPAGTRAAWIDDHLAEEHDATLWAARSNVLALAPDTRYGITPAMLHLLQTHYARP